MGSLSSNMNPSKGIKFPMEIGNWVPMTPLNPPGKQCLEICRNIQNEGEVILAMNCLF